MMIVKVRMVSYNVKWHGKMGDMLGILIMPLWFNRAVRARKRLVTIGCNTAEIRTGKVTVTPAFSLELPDIIVFCGFSIFAIHVPLIDTRGLNKYYLCVYSPCFAYSLWLAEYTCFAIGNSFCWSQNFSLCSVFKVVPFCILFEYWNETFHVCSCCK